jgi:hypothetical protein
MGLVKTSEPLVPAFSRLSGRTPFLHRLRLTMDLPSTLGLEFPSWKTSLGLGAKFHIFQKSSTEANSDTYMVGRRVVGWSRSVRVSVRARAGAEDVQGDVDSTVHGAVSSHLLGNLLGSLTVNLPQNPRVLKRMCTVVVISHPTVSQSPLEDVELEEGVSPKCASPHATRTRWSCTRTTHLWPNSWIGS